MTCNTAVKRSSHSKVCVCVAAGGACESIDPTNNEQKSQMRGACVFGRACVGRGGGAELQYNSQAIVSFQGGRVYSSGDGEGVGGNWHPSIDPNHNEKMSQCGMYVSYVYMWAEGGGGVGVQFLVWLRDWHVHKLTTHLLTQLELHFLVVCKKQLFERDGVAVVEPPKHDATRTRRDLLAERYTCPRNVESVTVR